MTGNLEYILHQRKKVVVWLHSGHAAYAENRSGSGTSTGDLLKKRGNNLVNVAFTAIEGEARHYDFTQPFILKKAPRNSIEKATKNLSTDHLFIDLRPMRSDERLRIKKYKAQMLGFRYRKKKWHEKFDAVVAIRRMKPSTPMPGS